MRTVAKMYNIYNVLFSETMYQAALKLEDGKERVREVFASIDVDDLEWLRLYGGYASMENLFCSIYKTYDEAEADVIDHNN